MLLWRGGAQNRCMEARGASHRGPRRARRIARGLRTRPGDVVDVFVYVVVLNLAVEYVPQVLTEGFTVSLLTALLLKLVLEGVVVVKGWVLARFRAATSRAGRVLVGLLVWVVAAGSKFVVLLAVDVVFGEAVSLGGFVSVTLLVVALLLSRAGVRWLLVGDQTG